MSNVEVVARLLDFARRKGFLVVRRLIMETRSVSFEVTHLRNREAAEEAQLQRESARADAHDAVLL